MFTHRLRLLTMMLALGLALAACAAAEHQGGAGDTGYTPALYDQGGNG